MKHCFVFVLLLAYLSTAEAQWQEVASYPGTAALAPVSFVIGNKAYVGCGIGSSEFFEYTPATDSWKQIAEIPGGPRGFAFGFSIDGIGYVGTGDPDGDTVNAKFDFWAYDPIGNTWTRKADYTFLPRAGTYSFVFNGKGYVGGGFNNLGLYGDLYAYDPATDTWVGNVDIPEYQWMSTSAYWSVNDKLYVGTGSEKIETSGFGRWKRKKSIQTDKFYEFDPVKGEWTQLASFPGDPREGCVGFAAGGKMYIGGGVGGPFSTSTPYNDIWCYDRESNSWSSVAPTALPSNYTMWCNAFNINNTVYIGLGSNLPQRVTSPKFFKYEFGSLLTTSLLSNQLTMNSITQGSAKDSTFLLINKGSSPLTISQIDISGAATIFTFQGPTLPKQLGVGESVQITITAAPSAIGNFTASLNVTSDAKNGAELHVPISVEGRLPAPIISLSTESIAFPNIASGTSSTQSFTIHNDGEAVLNISNLYVTDDLKKYFSLPNTTPPIQIPVEGTHTVDVKFAPATGGAFTGTVVIESNAANGSTQKILLSGSAGTVERKLDILTSSVTIDGVEVGTFKEGTITIRNPGPNAVTITNLSIDADPDGLFSIDATPTPFVMSGNVSEDIGIIFTPAAEGTFTANLKIQSNSDNNPSKLIPLTGISYAPTASAIRLEPEGLDFGIVRLNETQDLQFTVHSIGTLKLRIDEVAIEGAQAGSFSIIGYTPPTTLLPSGTKKITVRFAPTLILDHEAQVAVTSDAKGAETVYLPLYGYTPDPTGIGDPISIPSTKDIALFPNPVRVGDVVHYNFDGIAPATTSIALYNIYGQVVYQQPAFELQPGAHTLQLGNSHLPPGMYLLSFYFGTQPTSVPLVILKR